MIIHYNSKLKELSRKLRKNSTYGEIALWKALRARQLRGCQFSRQKPIDNFVVDFFCAKLKLIIEIDGITHNDKLDEDRFRQKKLESLGLNVIRFTEEEVRSNLPGVVKAIEKYIARSQETQAC